MAFRQVRQQSVELDHVQLAFGNGQADEIRRQRQAAAQRVHVVNGDLVQVGRVFLVNGDSVGAVNETQAAHVLQMTQHETDVHVDWVARQHIRFLELQCFQ